MKNKKIYCVGLFTAIMAVFMTGCEKLDTEYLKFLDKKEIIYPAGPADIQSEPGYKKVRFDWAPSTDPTIDSYVIYWNDFLDSAILAVPEGKATQFTGGDVDDLPEGTYFFTIYALDKQKNRSKAATVNNVNVYGDLYLQGLTNRTVANTSLDSDNNIDVSFEPPVDNTNVNTELVYTSSSGQKKTVLLPASENEISINDWLVGTAVLYRSSFKPEVNAIDTFYVDHYDTLRIKLDVSATYLKNYMQPFASVQQSSDRFKDPLNWKVNTAVQNHNNMGGWGSDDGTVLCMESGWGAPNIVNGKIYQTINLPSGSYTMEVGLGNNGINSSVVKIAAVAGDVFPDLNGTQVPGALGATDITQKTLTFNVTQSGMVTIGFLVNMTGNQFWRVNKVTLYKNL